MLITAMLYIFASYPGSFLVRILSVSFIRGSIMFQSAVLFSYREKTGGNIYNVSEWVVKSAKGLILLNKRRDAMNQLYDTTK